MKNYFLLIFLSICVIFNSCTKEQVPLNNDQIKTSKDLNREIVKLNSGILVSKIDTNYYLQGDIRLTKDQLDFLKAPQTKSAYTSNFVTYWPNSIVYYKIPTSIPDVQKYLINYAINEYKNYTPLDFKEDTVSTGNFITFVYDPTKDFCDSNVGMIGGKQIILLGNGFEIFDVMHEIGHSIGFFHEHCRNDRNNYVQINWGNIKSGAEGNFQIQSFTTDYGNYDFASIMHYRSRAFAVDSLVNTIYDLSNWGRIWDKNTVFSNGDIDGINYLYGGPYNSIYSEQIYDHPDAFLIIEQYPYTEEYKGFQDNYIVFYSDQNRQNECVLQKPRLVNYTLYDDYPYGNPVTNYQIVVPAGVSRAYLGETYLHYKEVQSNYVFQYRSWIVIR